MFVAKGTFPDGSPVAPMDPPKRGGNAGQMQTPSQHAQTPQANVQGQAPQQSPWKTSAPNNTQTGCGTPTAANAWPNTTPGQQAGAWETQAQGTPVSNHDSKNSSSIDHFAQGDKGGKNGWGDKTGDDQGANTGWDNDANKDEGGNGWGNTNGNGNQATNTGWNNDANNDQGGNTWGDTAGNGNQADNNNAAAGGWGDTAQDNKGANAGWSGGEANQTSNDNNNDWEKAGAPAQNNDAQGWEATTKNNNATGNAWGDSHNDAWDTSNKAPPRSTGSVRSSGASTRASYDPKAHVKPYWAEWRGDHKTHGPSASRPREAPREAYSYPAGPKPTLPAGKSTEASHGVQAGRGADYTHRTYRPIYLDEMEMPYAVFTFKYRSKNRLEDILKRSIGTECEKIETDVEKGELMGLSKEQLVERLMRSKLGPARKPPSVQGLGNGWANGAGDEPDRAGGGDGWSKQGGGGDGNVVDNWNSGKNDAADGWDNQSKESSRSQNKWDSGNNDVAGGWDQQSKKSSKPQNGWDSGDNATTGGAGGWDNQSNKSKASHRKDNWNTNAGSKSGGDGGWAQTGGGQTGGATGWNQTGAGQTGGNGGWDQTGAGQTGASGGWAPAGEGKTGGNGGWSNAGSEPAEQGGGGWDDTQKPSAPANASWYTALPKADPNFQMPEAKVGKKTLW